jgi:hypothetical protein
MTTTYDKGTYRAEVLDQGFEESASKGTPFFFLQLQILGKYDDQGQLQDCPQYERTYRQYLANETGARILCGDLRALEVEVADLTQLDVAATNAVRLVGRIIDMVCKLETYQGQQKERWGIPRTHKKLDLSAVRTLSDQFGHLLRGNGNGQDKPAPAVTEANQSDTPF